MEVLIVANWKGNPSTLAEAKLLFNSVKKGIKNFKNVEVVICPPFIYLLEFLSRGRKSQVRLGAQDVFWEESGAFTGEISPKMLKNLGLEYVIVGHSERRKYLNETDEMINKKLNTTFKAKLKPILCVGETREERKKGKTFAVLKKQLKKNLKSIFNLKSKILNLIVAYEPVWAIGTGNPCGILEAKEANLFIKKTLHQLLSPSTYQLLYGGSVNFQNARDFIEKAHFQGLLIGGVSLKAAEFIQIVRNLSNIKSNEKCHLDEQNRNTLLV